MAMMTREETTVRAVAGHKVHNILLCSTGRAVPGYPPGAEYITWVNWSRGRWTQSAEYFT